MLRSPFHPGRFLRQLLAEHAITQTQLARHLHVQIGVINQICTEKRGICAAMAISLSQALGTSAEFWLHLQTAYDLGRQAPRPAIKPLVRVA